MKIMKEEIGGFLNLNESFKEVFGNMSDLNEGKTSDVEAKEVFNTLYDKFLKADNYKPTAWDKTTIKRVDMPYKNNELTLSSRKSTKNPDLVLTIFINENGVGDIVTTNISENYNSFLSFKNACIKSIKLIKK